MTRVVVVGAGLGGLSAACHLVGRGHAVTVLERADEPGGRASQLREAGFRIDAGPTVLTMTGLIDEALRAAGSSLRERLQLVPLDPMYRATFAAGSDPQGDGEIRVRRGREEMIAEIRSVAGSRDARAFARFADWLAQLYELEMPGFIARNFDRPTDLLRPPGALLRLVRLGGLRRLGSVVRSYFDDPRLQRLFSFQALYAGLSPLEALATYAVITYMDSIEGVSFPLGGMHAVAEALAGAAGDAGAEFRYGTPVARIVRRPGRSGAVRGVELEDGEIVPADVVVANLEVPAVYRLLLDGLSAPLVARRGEYSPSAALWLAGLEGPPPAGAAHHNVHFGEAWESAFRELLRERRPMTDPSILVSLPALTDPALAPPGGQVLYALEPVPNLDGPVDWLTESPRLADRLREHLARLGYLRPDVTVGPSVFVDPPEWRRRGMERGTPFSLSHRFFQSGPFRPGNVDRRVPGLVLTGTGTVPGVGVPMVLVSGRLAAERVDELGSGR